LGALLRYTAPPPAADLGRAAPAPERVVQRFKFLASAYEEKSMSAGEQMAERGAILEALLPAAAVRKADLPPPVTDQMQAAAIVGRLQRLREANVITAEEQTRETDAVNRAVQAFAAQTEAAARAAAGMIPPAVAASPTGPGIRLSAYRSESQAFQAWATLQEKHPSELGQLKSVIAWEALRRGGGLYRLSAGPLPDRKAADKLCHILRRYRQSCQATTLQ
jgi:hypothetical protein